MSFVSWTCVKIYCRFLRIRILRFSSDREKIKSFPLYTDLRSYLCSCKGRVGTEFGVHNNKRTWMGSFRQHTCISWNENTWSGITGFQPIGTLGVFKQHGIETMCWTHWEPKSRYTWAFRETGCCLPSWRDEGIFSVIVVYIFADQVLISQNIDFIDFID
jgi:hypothetical protein